MHSNSPEKISLTNANKTQSFILQLQSKQFFRNKHNKFYIEGVRQFIQAVKNDYEISVIYFSDKLLIVPPARQLLRKLRRTGIPCINVSPETFRKTSIAKKASGISAIVSKKTLSLSTTPLKTGLCWLVLDKIQSEGNFGTLIRSSDAVGGAGFILLNSNVDPYSPNVIRASTGSVFNQNFIYATSMQLKNWLKQHHGHLIGTTTNGQHSFHHFSFPKNPVLFLGEERKGLTENQQKLCDHQVRIPMTGDLDSLNIGVAGSLILYEIFRDG